MLSLGPVTILLVLDFAAGFLALTPVMKILLALVPHGKLKLRSRDRVVRVVWIFSPFFILILCFLTSNPLVGIPMIVAELTKRQDRESIFEELDRHEQFLIFDVHCCSSFVSTDPLAAMTVVGHLQILLFLRLFLGTILEFRSKETALVRMRRLNHPQRRTLFSSRMSMGRSAAGRISRIFCLSSVSI